MVDFIVSRKGPIAPLLLLVDLFGPIRRIINSTVAATEIEKEIKKALKCKPYSWVGNGFGSPMSNRWIVPLMRYWALNINASAPPNYFWVLLNEWNYKRQFFKWTFVYREYLNSFKNKKNVLISPYTTKIIKIVLLHS